jgi:hypothetical protein
MSEMLTDIGVRLMIASPFITALLAALDMERRLAACHRILDEAR